MSEKFDLTIKGEELSRGLRSNEQTPRNSNTLVDCVGSVGRDDILCALDALEALEISGFRFPYPQVFVLRNMIIVCSESAIYEWKDSALALKYSSAPVGHRWHLFDSGEYVYLSNSKVALVRDINGAYATTFDLPIASSICNMNGQIVISGQMKTVAYLTSRPYAVEVVESVGILGGSLIEGELDYIPPPPPIPEQDYEYGLPEEITTDGSLISGKLGDLAYGYEESLTTDGNLLSGIFGDQKYSYEESLTTDGSLVSGKFGDINYKDGLPESLITDGSLIEGEHG